MLKYGQLNIFWHGHSAFRVEGEFRLYFDPYELQGDTPPADLVLISHEHFDHLSLADLHKIVTPATMIVAPAIAESELRKLHHDNVHYLPLGNSFAFRGARVRGVAAYNLNKFRAPGKPFHPKEDHKLGYVVGWSGVRLYHAGDTDAIEEMRQVRPIDVAMLPVSGTYVMTPAEAATAVEMIQPKLVIPMHWGSIVGSRRDAEQFEATVSGKADVSIMEKEAD